MNTEERYLNYPMRNNLILAIRYNPHQVSVATSTAVIYPEDAPGDIADASISSPSFIKTIEANFKNGIIVYSSENKQSTITLMKQESDGRYFFKIDIHYGKPDNLQHWEGIVPCESSSQPEPPEPDPEPSDKPSIQAPVYVDQKDHIEQEIESSIATNAGISLRSINALESNQDTREYSIYPYIHFCAFSDNYQRNLDFIEYKSNDSIIKQHFFLAVKNTALSPMANKRRHIQQLAQDYIDGKDQYANSFIGHNEKPQITLGPLFFLEKSYNLIWENKSQLSMESIYSTVEECTNTDIDDLLKLYQSHYDAIWNSYFALIIDSRANWSDLRRLSTIIIMMHALRFMSSNTKELFSIVCLRLMTASIVIPSAFLANSKIHSSPPKRNTVDAFAMGELFTIKKKTVAYSLGDIQKIQNVMPGEMKTVKNRSYQHNQEKQEKQTETDYKKSKDNSEHQDTELTSHIKQLANEVTTNDYQNLNTTYGAPTSITYGGSYTQTRSYPNDFASRKDIEKSAKSVINKAVDQVSRQVSNKRQTMSINETEHVVTSVLDNRNSQDRQLGIYRWLNKVYQMRNHHYGDRLILRFSIDNPAEPYQKTVHQHFNKDIVRPKPLADMGVVHYSDIQPNNFQSLCDTFHCEDYPLPPQDQKNVAATLNSGEAINLSLPKGYSVKHATATVDNSDAAKYYWTLAIGESFVSSTKSQEALTLSDETDQLPMAFNGYNQEKSPITLVTHLSVAIEIQCVPDKQALQEWQRRVYASLMKAYQRNMENYFETIQSLSQSPYTQAPSFSARNIERRTLTEQCQSILISSIKQYDNSRFDPSLGSSQIIINELLQQSVEWEQLCYVFDREHDLLANALPLFVDRYQVDALFLNFLNAKTSECYVPVELIKGLSVLLLLETGKLWEIAPQLSPVLDTQLDQAAAIKQRLVARMHAPTDDQNTEQDSWNITVPTDLIVLQQGSDLPSQEQ